MKTNAKCASCGRPIFWVKMLKSGKRNPVDVEPVENGNMVVTEGLDGDFFGEVLPKEDLAEKHEAGEMLHSSHFATCPGAARFRRKP